MRITLAAIKQINARSETVEQVNNITALRRYLAQDFVEFEKDQYFHNYLKLVREVNVIKTLLWRLAVYYYDDIRHYYETLAN